MLKHRLIALIASLFMGVLLIAGDNQLIKAEDAIRLAKQAADKMLMPPRMNDQAFISGVPMDNNRVKEATGRNQAASWPDLPGVSTAALGGFAGFVVEPTSADYSSPLWLQMLVVKHQHIGYSVTLTTEVASDPSGDGVDVIFKSSWVVDNATLQHSWKFHVDNALKVSFVAEQGDYLPVQVGIGS